MPPTACRLVGIITDGDLRRHLGPDVLTMTAETLMTPSPKTVASRALAVEALQLMDEHRITILFVVEDGRPSGLIQLYDCLRAGVA